MSSNPVQPIGRTAHLEVMSGIGVDGGRLRRPGLRWVAASTAAALLLVGCAAAPSSVAPGGQLSGSSSPGDEQPRDGVGIAAPTSDGDPQAALAAWQSFPVTSTPRPLVLTGGNVLNPPGGFATGDQKLAYVDGRFALATTLQTGPTAAAGFSLLSAKAALDQLRRHPPSTNSWNTAPPLRGTEATLTSANFGTDRGPRLLPAWRFTLAGVSGPAQVLAVAPEQQWAPKPALLEPTVRASIAADDQTVTYSFIGGPAGRPPCGSDYTGKATESRTAAVLSVQLVTPPASTSPGQDPVACTAIGAQRTVTVRLAAPLGGRVLLTAQGAPIQVVGG